MYKNIKNIFFLLPVIIFLFLVIKYYFSEQNLMLTNKSRSTYILSLNKYSNIIPLLKSDTNNIIIYMNDLEKFNNKRKKRAWEKLIEN